ncbi:MAG TPA: hypothetical protein VF510_12750 [Ktedonobacterales bacterium]
MSKRDKLLAQILSGKHDTNIDFEATYNLLEHLNFNKRIHGSHHIFTYPGYTGLIDLQPAGRHCKPYQVEQVRKVLNDLGMH